MGKTRRTRASIQAAFADQPSSPRAKRPQRGRPPKEALSPQELESVVCNYHCQG